MPPDRVRPVAAPGVGNAVKRWFAHGVHRADHLTHVSRRHRLVYLEVPKAGCTTIKRILQHSESEGRFPAERVQQRGESPLAAPVRDGFDLDQLFAPDSSWLTFTFVRNPFSRALSCYLEKIEGPPRPGQRNLRTHNLGLPEGQQISFPEFLELVARQRPRRMDIHWAPQTRLVSWGRIRPGLVGRFESFETDLRRLMTVADVQVPDVLVTRRTAHTTNARSRLAEFYQDARCVDLVRSIYDDDFDAFGYGRDPRFG